MNPYKCKKDGCRYHAKSLFDSSKYEVRCENLSVDIYENVCTTRQALHVAKHR